MPRTNPRARTEDLQLLISGQLPPPAETSQATFWHNDVTSLTLSRWACLAGWKRAVTRWVIAPGTLGGLAMSYIQDPTATLNAGGAIAASVAIAAGRHAARRTRTRHFRRVYVKPMAHAIAPTLRENPWKPDRWIHISPDMAGLAGRLVKPMSPAETAVRDLYGARVQPTLMWAPERAMRAYWWTHDRTGTARKVLDWFRVPTESKPARLEITIRAGFANRTRRELIREAVVAKLGMSDLVESWEQVGPVATVTYTVRERPPASVGMDDSPTQKGIRDHLTGLAEHEFCVGLTTGGRPVIISLDDDAPHIACSAGSGAGKSVLAKLLAMQVIAKGGRVVIFDRKGSHRWARGMTGVTYYTKPADMHHGLIELAQLADQRNDQALIEDDGWDPGQRVFVIFEEMNATIPQLRQWWDDNREKSDPKTSPAVSAFRNVMFMGRSAKTNLFGVAQMLTANTTGGPEARENFGVRALARYTANNWKMLAPECPMPRRSKTRGRWQFVIAGESTETQVAFISDQELFDYLAHVPMSPSPQMPATQGVPAGTAVDGDTAAELLTLRDAQARFCPGIDYEALKKRRTRARKTGGGPKFAAMKGRNELYDPDELLRWLTVESLTSTETPNV